MPAGRLMLARFKRAAGWVTLQGQRTAEWQPGLLGL